ncbi:hypothetical protein GOP47_0025841 [Adiantum capillus-veneris]|uniref:Uncharacterized protein n=1 Tax=Adiantum capillus-veneris TaxID=13818 RepID=A0A9D4U1D4_ADICA|nr:hypothetical protein GOP47_0025841 [Adiantum capillus-veneris]
MVSKISICICESLNAITSFDTTNAAWLASVIGTNSSRASSKSIISSSSYVVGCSSLLLSQGARNSSNTSSSRSISSIPSSLEEPPNM